MARLRFLAHAVAATTLAAGLLTAAFAGTADACSCYPGDNEGWRYSRADQVFTGVVLSEKREINKPDDVYDDQYRYQIRVGIEYKGDVPRWVNVYSVIGTGPGSCGVRLIVGTKYLVFAKGNYPADRLTTEHCSGTRLASGGPPTTTPGTSTTSPPTTPCATAAP